LEYHVDINKDCIEGVRSQETYSQCFQEKMIKENFPSGIIQHIDCDCEKEDDEY